MACRCTEMKELVDDIKILEEIQGKISNLNSEDDLVFDSLSSIAGVIDDTVITSGDVSAKLMFLNHRTKLAIDDMETKVNAKTSEAKSKLFDYVKEDLFWHVTHPFG